MASGDILVFIILKANLEHVGQYLKWVLATGLPQKAHFLVGVWGIEFSGQLPEMDEFCDWLQYQNQDTL